MYRKWGSTLTMPGSHDVTKHAKVDFDEKEEKFLQENEVCRIATSLNEVPHIAPVSYLYEGGFFFFATDYGTKKYANLIRNNNIALDVDVYGSSVDNKAVIVQGVVEFIERGSEFRRLYTIFQSRFEWARRDPWNEGEAPFVRVIPNRKVSWGL